ncbi:replication protein [Bacillus alveayuensis]|uniref:replication protein n=1 Tax=Aeribacillus alveayuensis TaxID=279215 RepID=UPI000697A123|nr:replication protein [Bacillus alveayuensis]
MADVQLENGYTKIANEILERMALTKLSPIQYRLIFVIWRYTYGFNRKEHEFSLSFLSKATKYDQRQLQRELAKLEQRKIILQKVQPGKPRIISFNKNYDEWVDEETLGNSTIGKVTNGNSTKGTFGNSTEGTLGNPTKEEIKNINKNLNKDDDIGTPNPFVEFENTFGYLPPQMLIEEFNYWIDESQFVEPEAIICEVIKRARLQIPRNPARYVSKILKDLHNLGLFTLDAVKEYNQKFDQKTKQRTGKTKVVVTEKHGRDIPNDFVFDINAGEDWP